MEQPILVPLNKLPKGISSTSQASLDQRFVGCLVHDHLELRRRHRDESSHRIKKRTHRVCYPCVRPRSSGTIVTTVKIDLVVHSQLKQFDTEFDVQFDSALFRGDEFHIENVSRFASQPFGALDQTFIILFHQRH